MPVEVSKYCGNARGLPVVMSSPQSSPTLNRFKFVYVSSSVWGPYSRSIFQLWPDDNFICWSPEGKVLTFRLLFVMFL